MKLAIAVVVLLNAAGLAVADRIDVGSGTIQLLDGFKHERQQGRDTLVGRITDAAGRLEIRYEIGEMAGAAMHAGRKADCIWYREQVVGGRRICSGLLKDGAGRELLVTIMSAEGIKADKKATWANFAAKVATEEDVADTLLTALSYVNKR